MKKAAFVSDIHLNLRSNKEWERGRFLALFSELSKNDSDTIILGGDIFDFPNPTLEELKVFYSALSLLQDKKVYLIAGNHENISEIATVFDYIPHVNFTYLNDEVLTIPGYTLYFTSHIKIKQLLDKKGVIKSNTKNILFSHFRANYGTFIKGEIDVKEVSNIFDYVFAGDIHHKYSPFHNVFYPSSPYGVSYEPLRDYGYYELVFDKTFSFTWKRLQLPSKCLIEYDIDNMNISDLDPIHKYKINILGDPDSKLASSLTKVPHIASFDFKVQDTANTSEFEELVDSLSTHVEEDIPETLIKLLKTNEYPITDSLEEYLRVVLLNARD